MKKHVVLSLIFSALFSAGLVFWPFQARADGREFSATIVNKRDGQAVGSRLYYTRQKQRIEADAPETGEAAVVIVRLDKDVVWTVLPAEKIYMEIPLTGQAEAPVARDPDNAVERKKLGKETIDGHPTIKEKVTFKDADGNKESFYWWYATDINWPVKQTALDGSWSQEYKDIRFGRQDPKVFEVPEGYRRMKDAAPDAGDDTDNDSPVLPGPPDQYVNPPGVPDIPAPPMPDAPDIPSPWL